MSDFTVFYPRLMQYAPGCAEPAMEDAIRLAVIDFCENTRLWRYSVDVATAAFGPIAITTPTDSVIFDIEMSRVDGQRLEPATTFYLDDQFDDWRDSTCTGQPQYVTQLSEDEISIVPWQACTISLRVRLKPSIDAETIPDFIALKYQSTIQSGALSRLLMLPGQPFTNPDLAMSFAAQFQRDLDKFSSQQTTGQQRAPARTKARFF